MKDDFKQIDIGEWNYNSKYGLMSNNGTEFFLDPRLNKLFSHLLNHGNRIILRQEILETVWDEVEVNDDSLTKAVFDLRQVLKKNGVSNLEIETIRNVGYRLRTPNSFPATYQSNVVRKILKASMYLFAFFAFLILLIRAIRY